MAKTGKTGLMAFDPETRAGTIADFLARAGWGEAARTPLGQDASTRRYERLTQADGRTAMLMDAPPVEDAPCPPDADEHTRRTMGWNASTRLAASRVDAFVALAGELARRGLTTPAILAHDSADGLAVIEDFGSAREFARLIEAGADEPALYRTAGETLAHLHRDEPPDTAEGHGERWPILDFDSLALKTNADLFAEWLPRLDLRLRLDAAALARWENARDALIQQALELPRAFTLRDYHAENLLWLDGREGIARVGLLDFQDAVRGWAGWDIAMLTQDARREVSTAAREAALAAYLDGTGSSRERIETELAIIGTLNALRIAGLFARLIARDGKPRYRAFLQRQHALLARNLTHPAVRDMASYLREVAPFLREADR